MTDQEQKLVEFGKRMLEITKECIQEGAFDCDAEMMAEAAVKCGLIDNPIYDPDVHGQIEAEPGDRIYFWEATS